jgi:hypothetical protein
MVQMAVHTAAHTVALHGVVTKARVAQRALRLAMEVTEVRVALRLAMEVTEAMGAL